MSMIGTVIGLLLMLALLGVIWHVVFNMWLPQLSIAEPFMSIIRGVLLILVAVIIIWAIVVLLGLAGIHVPQFR